MLVWAILIGLGGIVHLLIILAMLRANWLFAQADHDAEHAFEDYLHDHQQAQRRSA
jgi:hypothetical protein